MASSNLHMSIYDICVDACDFATLHDGGAKSGQDVLWRGARAAKGVHMEGQEVHTNLVQEMLELEFTGQKQHRHSLTSNILCAHRCVSWFLELEIYHC